VLAPMCRFGALRVLYGTHQPGRAVPRGGVQGDADRDWDEAERGASACILRIEVMLSLHR
jgi:hypothetical protein